jgi:O-antigen ligase/polysaccharide polymerase Wzy-like membrane protein
LSSIVLALRSHVKPLALSGAAVATCALAGLVFFLAYEGGSYALERRAPLAIALWWTVIMAVALGLWPLARVPRIALGMGALLAGYAALALASMGWSSSAERAFAEFNRVSLYLAVFCVAVLAGTAMNAKVWSDGFALGIAATGLLALASRLLPGLVPGSDVGTLLPSAATRLAYPLGYWNGLAIFLALAYPLLLRIAVTDRRTLARAGAVGVLPALTAVIYLASSRGGFAVAAVGSAAFVALIDRRWTAAGAVACVAAGSAATIAILLARPDLVNRPSTISAGEGRTAALLIALGCLGTGFLYAFFSRLLADRPLGPRLRRLIAVVAGAAGVAAVVVAHPLARFDAFREPLQLTTAAEDDFVRTHLLSGNGSGRWQFWEAALDEFRDAPFHGHGAGSYEAWWAAHGTIPMFVRDAHSLYLEALGELGIGGGLVIAVFALGLVVAVRRVLRTEGPGRATAAALAAAFAAYAVAAGIDWMWELTAVSVFGIAVLGLLCGPATFPAVRPRGTGGFSLERHPPARRRFTLVAVGLGVAWLLICAQAIPLLAQLQIGDSQEAALRGDHAGALGDAFAARKLEPWASSPYLQLALLKEEDADLQAARGWIAKAIDRDREDWRLWLVAARIETKQGAIGAARASLAQAARLNPRSPLFQRS